ncbi:2'-deoxynucleoside 5'-phosphate N-hydrolase 1-like [Dendronephthya gigantea]|uniref:2'-deoxynucleoside 5'-phosphate N-hydrolase 1-like n=1 Tax=Dendronephthya gigantea TaxID=151771 RepID=UPI001068FEC2|nr:2'-deoxynucleoside 5'-phosphate N-hydrolase 1-like [Dendronephthya gigantea]
MEKSKFYFAASIRGGRDDVELYRELISYMQTFGKVLTEHIGYESLVDSGERNKNDKFIHDRDMAWLDESDAMIAEVTQPSLGVGYEIGRALEQEKKILCLFRPDSGKVLSAMIRGAEDGKQMVVKDYQGDEAKKIIKDFLTANNLI